MFSINFIIYNANVAEREPSKFDNPAERRSFSGVCSFSLHEQTHPRTVRDLRP
jgi:hypothetical protein